MKKHPLSLALAAVAVLALNSCDAPPPGMSASGGGATAAPIVAVAPGVAPAPVAPAAAPVPVVAKAPEPVRAAPATPAAVPAGPLQKVSPKMPEPLFAGTPLPADNTIPNLDKAGTPPVLTADLPEGSKLLSMKAKVTSSCPNPFTGTLDLVTDGEKDGSDGYFVELDPGKQWVQIDLGETKEVWGLWMWHFHKAAFVYKGVVVQVSNDADCKNATIIYNNDYDNSVGLGVGKDNSYTETNNGRYVAGKGTKGRYVRLWSNGRYLDEMNHYIEVEIYGK